MPARDLWSRPLTLVTLRAKGRASAAFLRIAMRSVRGHSSLRRDGRAGQLVASAERAQETQPRQAVCNKDSDRFKQHAEQQQQRCRRRAHVPKTTRGNSKAQAKLQTPALTMKAEILLRVPLSLPMKINRFLCKVRPAEDLSPCKTFTRGIPGNTSTAYHEENEEMIPLTTPSSAAGSRPRFHDQTRSEPRWALAWRNSLSRASASLPLARNHLSAL